jgi:hypothetical protein
MYDAGFHEFGGPCEIPQPAVRPAPIGLISVGRWFVEKTVPRSSGSRSRRLVVWVARSGCLTTSVKHHSIEWPCGIMAEVDTEWCRGLSTEGRLGLGVHLQAGARKRTLVTAKIPTAPQVILRERSRKKR